MSNLRHEVVKTLLDLCITDLSALYLDVDDYGWGYTLVSTVVVFMAIEAAAYDHCVATGEAPTVITPEESREAVRACLAAEESARTGQLVRI